MRLKRFLLSIVLTLKKTNKDLSHFSNSKIPLILKATHLLSIQKSLQVEPGLTSQKTISKKFPVLHTDTWSITLLVDQTFFDKNPTLQKDPALWTFSSLRVFRPGKLRNVRLFLAVSEDSPFPVIIASQFDIAEYDAYSASRLLHLRLNEWIHEINNKFGKCSFCNENQSTQEKYESNETLTHIPPSSTLVESHYMDTSSNESCRKNRKATVLSVLAELGRPDITTLEQRKTIRRIVTDYLNNDISVKRFFAFLAQVVGWHTLCLVIQNLYDSNPLHDEDTSKSQTQTINENADVQNFFSHFHQFRKQKFILLQESFHFPLVKVTPMYLAVILKYFLRHIKYINLCPSVNKTQVFGKRLVTSQGHAFLMGGTHVQSNNDTQDVLNPTFQEIKLFDLSDVSEKTLMLDASCRYCPPSLVYHIMHSAFLTKGSTMLVHGGMHLSPNNTSLVAKENDQVQLNIGLFGFHVASERWMILDSHATRRPCARHSHASVVYPLDGTTPSKYLIIFGGVGKKASESLTVSKRFLHTAPAAFQMLISSFSEELECLNDLWIFNFQTGIWSCIDVLPGPCPRYGMTLTWVTPTTLLLIGGETRNQESSVPFIKNYQKFRGTPPGQPNILQDSWILSWISLEKVGDDFSTSQMVWEKLCGEHKPFAHYASVGITVCINPMTSKSFFHDGIDETTKLPLSINKNPLKFWIQAGWIFQRVIVLISGTSLKDNNIVDLPFLSLALVVTKKDKSLDLHWLELDVRQLFEKTPPFVSRRGHSALFFYASEQSFAEAYLQEEAENKKLNNISLKKISFLDSCTKVRSLMTSQFSPRCPCILVTEGIQSTGSLISQMCVLNLSHMIPNISSKCSPAFLNPVFSLGEETNDHLRIKFEDCATQLTLNSVATTKSIYPYEIESTCHLYTSLGGFCEHVFTAFGHLIQNISDKRINATRIDIHFDVWRGTEAIIVTDDGIGFSHMDLQHLLKTFGRTSENFFDSNSSQFGIGFKLAASSLGNSCLVLTKTGASIGVGLYSSLLLAMYPSSRLSTPIVFWSSVTGLPLKQRFQEIHSSQNLHLILSTTPVDSMNLMNEEFSTFSKGTRMIFFNLHPETPRITDDGLICVPSKKHSSHFLQRSVHLQDNFPLFSNPRTTIDHNLLTYLFWVHLHCAPMIYINNVPLIPTGATLTDEKSSVAPKTDENVESASTLINKEEKITLISGLKLLNKDFYTNTLYRFLQKRLYHKLELPFLFRPLYGDHDSYGLIGFLNNPDSPNEPLVYEAGVLLYHKGRFINRAMHSIPAKHFTPSLGIFNYRFTAVINVPNFFLTRATKESFIIDGDLFLHDFYDQLEKVFQEYLNVHTNPKKLEALQKRYSEKFDKYRKNTWDARVQLQPNTKANPVTYTSLDSYDFIMNEPNVSSDSKPTEELAPQKSSSWCAPSDCNVWQVQTQCLPNSLRRSQRLMSTDVEAELTDPIDISDAKDDSPNFLNRYYTKSTYRRRRKNIN